MNVPIYDTDSAPQAERIINDSTVKLAIADNRERYDRLDSVIDNCPTLQRILMLDGNALGALEGLGVAVSDEEAGGADRVGGRGRPGHHRVHVRVHGHAEGRGADASQLPEHRARRGSRVCLFNGIVAG